MAPSARGEKTRSAQSLQPPRTGAGTDTGAGTGAGTGTGTGTGSGSGAVLGAAGTPTARPGLKARAHSAPLSPAHDAHDDDDDDEIAGDSFFQRYHFPQATALAAACTADASPETDVDSSSDTEGPLSPTRRHTYHDDEDEDEDEDDVNSSNNSNSNNSNNNNNNNNSNNTTTTQDLTFAVLGARSAGKSTFIRRALGLPDATAPAACARRWTIDGTPFLVRILEMSFNDVHVGDRHRISWPDTVHDMATPPIHGALALYDVTSEASLARVPDMLTILARSHLPFVLAACKCDQHPAHREVDPAVVEQKAQALLANLRVFSTSHSAPDSHRACLSALIAAALSSPRSHPSSRRRATSSAVSSLAHNDSWANTKHERAASEASSHYSHNRRFTHVKNNTTTSMSFFNDDSPHYDSDDSADASDTAPSIMTMQPSDENGYTFDQLVDRLLAQPMSKMDSKFVSVFLALYRRFSTPSQLLDAILKRFDLLAKNKDMPMIRVITQLRYLAVLHQWVAYYPGDFAYPATRKLIRKFASSLSPNREFSIAAVEIARNLDMVADDDDDTEWACTDRHRAQSGDLPAFYNAVLDEESEDDDFARAVGHMSMGSDTLSVARSSTTTRSKSNGSFASSLTLVTQVERNERLARQLEPNPTKPLSKAHWHALMLCDDDVIARELTRMDWIMFSSVRPRDLVRHVSLSTEARKQCKQLENVTRMTAHFNHIAFLVTNYILLRDKPKHRALMLEKWMRIARQVRKLNNYNSLGAIIAGVKGTAVHRLLATRDLVPQPVNHDFLKLDILMGPQKSHFAYRLAWENSSGERIPYIPLYRRDLVSASEGSSTFVGTKPAAPTFSPHPGTSVFAGAAGQRDSKEAPPGGVVGKERINWRKFEIMGDVIVGIQRAQGTPYPAWQKCEEVRALVLDVKISKDDDELYERSTHLEATGANEKGRFAKWLEKR